MRGPPQGRPIEKMPSGGGTKYRNYAPVFNFCSYLLDTSCVGEITPIKHFPKILYNFYCEKKNIWIFSIFSPFQIINIPCFSSVIFFCMHIRRTFGQPIGFLVLAVTFLEYWKRKSASLAHHWDCIGFQVSYNSGQGHL